MTKVSVVNNQVNDNKFRNLAVGTGVAIAGYEIEPFIKQGLLYPVRKKTSSGIKSIQGSGFKPYVQRALEQNGLKNEISIIDLNTNNAQAVKKQLGLDNIKLSTKTKIIRHLKRFPNKITRTFDRTLAGENAFFNPVKNVVVCNFEKFGAPIFHEIGHKMNNTSKNLIVRLLRKARNPLTIWGTMGVSIIAMLKNPKEKREYPRNIFDKTTDFVKDNCGLVSTAMMLPLTAEEFLASIKGEKIAKKAGVQGDLLKKVQKAHKISMTSYAMAAVATGLAIYLTNKLRDFVYLKMIEKK